MNNITFLSAFFLLLVSCGSSVSEQHEQLSEVLPDGATLFVENCAACHGRDGTLKKAGSKDLTQITLNFDQIKNVVEFGTDKGMPRFKEVLGSTENVEAVSSHVLGFQRTINLNSSQVN